MPAKRSSDADTYAFLAKLEKDYDSPPPRRTPDDLTENITKSTEDFARIVTPWGGNQVQAPAQWMYNKNEYVKHFTGTAFIGIGAIARKVAMQPAKVKRLIRTKSGTKKEEVESTHPLCVLFEEVNPIHTQYDLWYQMVAWRLMTGDSYWWKARNGFNTIQELWPIPSQWVWAIPSSVKFIDHYLVQNVFGPKTDIPAEDMLHIREPNIDWSGGGIFYGRPVVAACASAIDLEQAMFARLYHQFRNFTPPGMVYSTDKELGEDQFLDMLAQLRAQQQRSEKTGEPIVAHSGFKVNEFRTNAREMDYSSSLMTIMEYILAIVGVPKAVVGLTADFNRANVEGAIMSWCINTVNPLLTHLGQHLTQNLAHDFEDDLIVEFDQITYDDRDAIRQDVTAAVSAGAIEPNEVRDILLKKEKFKFGGDTPMIGQMQKAPYGNEKPDPPPSAVPGAPGAPGVPGQPAAAPAAAAAPASMPVHIVPNPKEKAAASANGKKNGEKNGAKKSRSLLSLLSPRKSLNDPGLNGSRKDRKDEDEDEE